MVSLWEYLFLGASSTGETSLRHSHKKSPSSFCTMTCKMSVLLVVQFVVIAVRVVYDVHTSNLSVRMDGGGHHHEGGHHVACWQHHGKYQRVL